MTTFSGSGNGYFRNEELGDGPTRVIRVHNNLLAVGPSTTSGTVWFFDYSGHSTGWTFGSNLYWDAGRGMAVITSDSARIAADPKFTSISHTRAKPLVCANELRPRRTQTKRQEAASSANW